MFRKPKPRWTHERKRKRVSSKRTISHSRSQSKRSQPKFGNSNDSEERRHSRPGKWVPVDGRERVKRCLNCEHFSTDLTNCNQCGSQLREDARLFLNPKDVTAVFKHLIESVTNMGPDFLPMRINLEDCDKCDVKPISTNGAHAKLSRISKAAVKVQREANTREEVSVEPIITITSDDDDESEFESQPELDINSNSHAVPDNNAHLSNIKDEDATDLVTQMQTAACPPNTNYFVKQCRRCWTYSFDLVKCETCKAKISPEAEIILYQSINKRKLKTDQWRKAKYHLARHEKDQIPIPVERCNLEMVNKVIAKKRHAEAGSTGTKKYKVPKISGSELQQTHDLANQSFRLLKKTKGKKGRKNWDNSKRVAKSLARRNAKEKRTWDRLDQSTKDDIKAKGEYEEFKRKLIR